MIAPAIQADMEGVIVPQLSAVNLQEAQERLCVVREALSWAGTPYHHQGRVKGSGVDCGQILAAVYEAAGIVDAPEIPQEYPPDWHVHRSEERYLATVERYATNVPDALPGDIVLFRFGRCLSHGGVVIRWPWIIHSYIGVGVILDNVEQNSNLSKRMAGFWSPWGKK